MIRARVLAGRSLGSIAGEVGWSTPSDLLRHKGWVGELIETSLGATASSLPQPDFPHLGIELKTIPIDANGMPCESTYVCTVPLEEAVGERWEGSWLRHKLARVLWIPVEAEKVIPLAERRVGNPLLWSPSSDEEALLRRDWEELMEMVCLGEIAHLTARFGEALQIRPKAAHARARRGGIGASGEAIATNPRGFYLRPTFTAAILKRHYACSANSYPSHP